MKLSKLMIKLIFLALATISHSSYLPRRRFKDLQGVKKILTVDDILGGKFSQYIFNGTWQSESEIIYKSVDSSLYIFDVENQESNLILSGDLLKNTLHASKTDLSNNRQFILTGSDYVHGFRHSSTYRYAVYDINSSQRYNVSNYEPLQLCKFFGEYGVVYVKDNNLYMKNEPDGIEIQITDDGKPGVIYNGVPDWVYEEEVMSSSSATWPSPGGTKIAFASFNDNLVKEEVYLTYAEPDGDKLNQQHSYIQRLRYPKAGQRNPNITLKVAHVNDNEVRLVDIPPPIDEVTADHILWNVVWISDSEFAAIWSNRRQNKAVTVICDTDAVECKTELIREERDGWIEPEIVKFSNDGATYLDIEPVTPEGAESWDQWYHLVKYTRGGYVRKDPVPLTFRRKTVTSIVGWNQDEDKIYYTASTEEAPWEQHLFVVSGGSESCISCGVTLPGGDRCTYALAWAAKDARYYTLSCNTYGNPSVTTIYNSNDVPAFIWNDNDYLRKLTSQYSLPKQMFLQYPIQQSKAAVQMLLPPELDINDTNTKYQMVVKIYVGPNSVEVSNKYQLFYESYLPTAKNTIYCKIDGRGTGRKGKKALFAVNNALGTVEVEDVIRVTKALAENFPWIDEKRIGLWGWSYGGYATAMALTKDDDNVFKCGVSVAPVITWMYYDTIYTERYMSLPQDNTAGYEACDVSQRADKMRGHQWMLIHGGADDNVHLQNAMLMARALQTKDIPFDMMVYPNEAHGLSGTTKHVFMLIDNYWRKCFN